MRIAAVLLGLGGAALWGVSRLPWLTVNVFDDKSGESTQDLVGAVWSTELTALALVLLAAMVAGLRAGASTPRQAVREPPVEAASP